MVFKIHRSVEFDIMVLQKYDEMVFEIVVD